VKGPCLGSPSYLTLFVYFLYFFNGGLKYCYDYTHTHTHTHTHTSILVRALQQVNINFF
jgi:hypothetical protein